MIANAFILRLKSSIGRYAVLQEYVALQFYCFYLQNEIKERRGDRKVGHVNSRHAELESCRSIICEMLSTVEKRHRGRQTFVHLPSFGRMI